MKALAAKIAEIMSVVEHVAKKGTNDAQGYKYLRESDLMDALRVQLSQRNIAVIPKVTKMESSIYTTANGKPMRMVSVAMDWTFVDSDTGDTITATCVGEGSDSGDKAVYKAITGCKKYVFFSMFMVGTGDDPEKDKGGRSRDTGASRGSSRRGSAAPTPTSSLEIARQQCAAVLGQLVTMYKECMARGDSWDGPVIPAGTMTNAVVIESIRVVLMGDGPFDRLSVNDTRRFYDALTALRDKNIPPGDTTDLGGPEAA